jgi:crotonobetainyl-CoA:carnitine CoA-transferase CaiB-like acyl-CoA transferase
MAVSLIDDEPWMPAPSTQAMANPLVGSYRTGDGRHLALCCLQAGQYWGQLAELLGRPELATDPRFATHEALMEHSAEAQAILTEVFAGATVDEWRTTLEPFAGQWAVMQHTLEAAADPQTAANGYLQECETVAGTPFRLVAAPVQYDEQPAPTRRAPEFNEHGDDILAEVGLDWDAIVELKVRGVVA